MEDDVTKDLAEFSLANAIYSALVEGHACEQSSRRNAMDNASKNAQGMIDSLTLQYNRGRQAAITNELVDIITGTLFRLVYLSFHTDCIVLNRCECALTYLEIESHVLEQS